MAENRRGLGRGLSALLGDVADDEAPAAASAGDRSSGSAEGAREIPIELIRNNPDQPRQHFSQAEIEELAESIRTSGVLQPILVRPAPNRPGEFEIVAGERRWRAAQRAGKTAIPALVRHMADDQAYEIAIVENVQREDLNAMEEARAYETLMSRMGYTQEQASKRWARAAATWPTPCACCSFRVRCRTMCCTAASRPATPGRSLPATIRRRSRRRWSPASSRSATPRPWSAPRPPVPGRRRSPPRAQGR